MPLTDRAIDNVKPNGGIQKISDGEGMYLHVSAVGGKSFRLAYRFDSKQKLLTIGKYPAVSLKDARRAKDEAKELLARGVDPAEYKKEMKNSTTARHVHSFEAIAREWHTKQKARKNPNKKSHWTERHAVQVIERLEKNVFPFIGNRPIRELKTAEILAVLQKIEDRACYELAHRVNQIIGQVFSYAITTDRAERNLAQDLKGALTPTRSEHHATITEPLEIGALLRAIDGYKGDFITACALKIAPLVFVRPGELRGAEWTEFNFDGAEWRIPKERMKMNLPHIVPLARQTLAILADLHKVTGDGRLLFPSPRTRERPISDNTVNAGLRRLGYSNDEIVGHGFRSMASTRLNEMNVWSDDAIERQLAHTPRNKVRASYNFAQFLPERRIMMQAWADYLDGLRRDTILSPRELLNPEQIDELKDSLLKGLRFGG